MKKKSYKIFIWFLPGSQKVALVFEVIGIRQLKDLFLMLATSYLPVSRYLPQCSAISKFRHVMCVVSKAVGSQSLGQIIQWASDKRINMKTMKALLAMRS